MRYISLFSGMECAHLAWAPLGWECVAVAEIDPRACEVLAHRLKASAPKYLPDGFDRKAYAHLPAFGSPGTIPNFGDVSQVTDDDVAALGRVDVLIGGSPCQDLSVAGKRAGLAGARSSLFHQQLRIFHAARALCGARFLVWENVPGAFSSNRGADFAVVVGTMAGCELEPPREGWGTEGVALGPSGLVEWGVLDAQWFGVAQRRRRVFAVLDAGAWSRRGPILLEPEGLRGDSPPRREAGERAAPTLAGCSNGGGANGPGRDVDSSESLVPVACWWDGGQVSQTLDAVLAKRQTMPEKNRFPAVLVPTIAWTGDGVTADPISASEADTYTHEGNGFRMHNVVQQGWAVRRLTPRECERLQGAEDDWTLVPSGRRGKPMADGPRYKMIGNSFARPVVAWLGAGIERAVRESAA